MNLFLILKTKTLQAV